MLECFDEPYEYTRTVYTPVTKQETYTAYRCETVSECQDQASDRVPEGLRDGQ